jgi:DNA helicase IV
VALHRAAYLLYTHRFPLEDQGVLVIGPNRVFLRYIERVLPSLGEAGVEQVVLSDLVPDVSFARPGVDADDSPAAARIKGDARMSSVIDRAVRDRQRPLREDLRVPFGTGYVRLTAEESARIVKAARRRARRHNAGRRFVEGELYAALAASARGDVTAGEVRQALRGVPEVRAALERMWPVLTPAQLLHDLFGSRALLRLAAGPVLTEAETAELYRPRAERVDDVRWTAADVALLDDAREALGPRPTKAGKASDADEIRTYGHLVVDEVQDLTPMQLKMAARRSLNGSMTVVGDLAQATGPLAPGRWADVLAHLPDRKPARVVGLSVGYRIPAQIMQLAERVMAAAAPDLRSPRAVRLGDAAPSIVAVDDRDDLFACVAEETAKMLNELSGNVAVVASDGRVDAVSAALTAAGIAHGRATRNGLDDDVTVVPVSVVKGLELDGVVVVEPAEIVADELLGLRALYVALTRPTQRLTVVHADALPAAMTDPVPQPA